MSLGFIIVRHVNSKRIDEYWIRSLQCIRTWYPNHPIVIIDDNSNQEFISTDIDLTNVTVIQSEFPKRGELLPYYYFYKLKPFDKAVIIHDSVFIQRDIDFDSVKDVSLLWSFTHEWDEDAQILHILQTLKNHEVLEALYGEKQYWLGCFGVMSCISHAFVSKLVDEYDIFRLLNTIDSRDKRMCLERIFAVMCYSLNDTPSMFGDIHDFVRWGVTIEEYKNDFHLQNRPIMKVWTGR